MKRIVKRGLWFVFLWVGGVLAVAGAGFLIRLALGF
jgi:hypothetical protein